MSILPKIFTLKEESQSEIYELFNKNIRSLKIKSDGSVDPIANDLINSDIDAMRHAYVSGVYTMEYGASIAEVLGRLNELVPGGSSTESPENLVKERNMDLWNNSIGRKYGKKSKSRNELFNYLLNALKNGELIIELNDSRKYEGASFIKMRPKGLVIVIQESVTGENIKFYDLDNKIELNKNEFVASIKFGDYPNYEIRTINGKETPVAKRDLYIFNNLG